MWLLSQFSGLLVEQVGGCGRRVAAGGGESKSQLSTEENHWWFGQGLRTDGYKGPNLNMI